MAMPVKHSPPRGLPGSLELNLNCPVFMHFLDSFYGKERQNVIHFDNTQRIVQNTVRRTGREAEKRNGSIS